MNRAEPKSSPTDQHARSIAAAIAKGRPPALTPELDQYFESSPRDPIHPHMLPHGCGYALANAGHDTRALQAWLGHKNIQHTVRYTELAPDRFKDFWR
jgi:site-specific recombinase XerD